MDLKELKGNSRTRKDDLPNITPVVTGRVSKQKPSVGSRLHEELNTQWADVLLPAAKDMVVDMLRSGLDGVIDICKKTIDMKIYGEVKHRRSSGRNSYSSYYSSTTKSSDSRSSYREATFDYENLRFENRADAKAVLDGLTDILEEYNVVSVADLVELAGGKAHYTEGNYGWFKLGRAEIIGTREGYILSMPKPQMIK